MGIRNYLRLYGHFVKNSIIAQMEYRANFILSILTECGFLLAKSLYIIVIFSAGLPIYGLEPKVMLMFIGSYTFITGIMDAVFYPNIAAIPAAIHNGDLDVYLAKPIDTLFYIGFRKFDIGLGIPNVLGGLIMIITSWYLSGVPINVGNILGYLAFTILGVFITFPILLIPVTFSFWIIRADALMDIIWAMWDFNNMPMTIYSRIIRLLGVFVVPIFVITNFAPLFIFGQLPWVYILYGLVAVPILITIGIAFWHFAITKYSSASS